jgi:metal-responsive CopG/Arc/MetJ family transcriptional regulator
VNHKARHQLTVFLTDEQLQKVDAIAQERQWHRSHAVRHLVQLGLEVETRRQRTAAEPVRNTDTLPPDT